MAYERVNWENLPSTKTPVNADNLNKMDKGIAEIDEKMNAKQDKLIAGTGIEITDENTINNINENYSTNEQKIGKWINGKPLYKKVIKTTMAETSQSGTYVNKDVSIGSNIDFGFVVKAILISGTQYMSLPYINNAGNNTKCFFDKNVSHLTLANGNSTFNNCETYVIIEYTKTTDKST